MIKKLVKKVARKLGIELSRFTPQTSDTARIQRILHHYQIDLVLDIGANIGQYSMLLRDLGYQGRIVSFEPLSSAYSTLTVVSSKDPLWKIAPRLAIGNVDRESVQINIAGNSQSSSILPMLNSHLNVAPNSAYTSSEMVPMKRLDTISEYYIDEDVKSIFLKIDTQGFETQVLEGASAILAKVEFIQIELSLIPLYEGEKLYNDMIALMYHLGYEVYAIIPGFTDPLTGRLLQMDGIFKKNESMFA
ncbi:FkbM family methyltransferase [Microcoleus sp. FACHB-672]|uniref:FkbM family methyltransferase n=1 Tax=Microcoleus sp. FACHB-672 TaxID=2692825 RepID=UPI001688AFBF|nr:FkbM family methyltransferase [Microcoleus sp. FACHB-672]MBD2040287.1 FkbM family methyltransferase [Microcoleus sp. FACHB-672]